MAKRRSCERRCLLFIYLLLLFIAKNYALVEYDLRLKLQIIKMIENCLDN